MIRPRPQPPENQPPDWMKEKKLVKEPSFEELRRARYEELFPGLREMAEALDALIEYYEGK